MSASVAINLASAYDQYFRSGLYRARYPRPNPAMTRLIAAALPDAPMGAVLDFGCGTGRYLPLLLARPGLVVTGYDISRAAIDTCAGRFGPEVAQGRLRLVCGGLPALLEATAPDSLDTVLLMFGVLGHIRGRAQRVATLSALRGLLRPGGRLLATVPNRRRRFAAEQRRCAALVTAGELEPGDILYRRVSAAGTLDLYYHLFTPEEFAADLQAAGFAQPRLGAESVLPERLAIAGRPGVLLDAALRALCPLAAAYGFAASVER
jgi:SAM-dependent methyltransferase